MPARRVDAGDRHQPADALLREILRADAVVARPLVDRRRRVVVDRHERELVQPRRDVAVGRDVAGGGAGAERDAENRVGAERHRAGERGHLAVVHHLERHVVPRSPHLEEEVLHPRVEQVVRHAAKERAGLDPVVDVDAGGAAADGVDARQVRGRLVQRVHDPVEVVLRVRLVVRIPHRLVAEDDPAVDDRRDLAIAAAEIEADAAALEMAAERLACRSARPAGRACARPRADDRTSARRRGPRRTVRSRCRDSARPARATSGAGPST